MRCPTCESRRESRREPASDRPELQGEETPQGVEIDRCPNCGGVWLDRSEIFHFSCDPRKFMGVLNLAMQFQVATEKASPQTGKPMLEIKLSPTLRLDYCPDSRGIWFDSGEFREFCLEQLGLDPSDAHADASPLLLGLEPLEGQTAAPMKSEAPLELSLVPIDDGPSAEELEADRALDLSLDNDIGVTAAASPASAGFGGGAAPAEFASGGGAGGQSATMVCPKCGASQARSDECGSCGIVIAKFLKRQNAEGAHAQTPGMQHDMSRVIAYSVDQRKEWSEILVGWERSNNYDVHIISDHGAIACEASEYSNSWVNAIGLQILGSLRPFTMMVKDEQARPIVRLKRPMTFYFHRLEVRDPAGAPIGTVLRKFALLGRKYVILDPGGRELLELNAGLFDIWEFSIEKSGHQVGELKKNWAGFFTEAYSDADSFAMRFDKELNAKEKLLLLGAVFLIDFAHFENNVGSLFRSRHSGTFRMPGL